MNNRIRLGVYLSVIYAFFISLIFMMPILSSSRIWILRIILFSLLTLILVLVSKYTWNLLSNFINKSTNIYLRIISKALLASILFLATASILFFNVLFEIDAPIIATICFSCLALYIKFLTFYWSIRLFQIPVLFFRSRFIHPNEPNRWSSYKSFPIVFAILTAHILTIYGIWQASLMPEVKKVEISLPNLPNSLNGYNILLISDIHLGITITKNHLDKIVDSVNDLNADIIVLAGDLTDLSVNNGRYMSESLNNFKSKYGKFFVTGNHEYYTNDIDNWLSFLHNDLNFIILNNKNVKIYDKNNDNYFYLAGVDDLEAARMALDGHGMDLDKALKSCIPGYPIILLAHQPKAAKIALQSKYNISLVLSGHTHGGQMFPVSIGVYLTNPFFRGLYSYGSGQVYVTQGTYYWGFPIRTFSHSEITHITLYSK